MNKKLYPPLFIAIICFLSAVFSPGFAGAQGRQWRVWVKTSPCSGRFDWISVAKENPGTGGTGFFTEAYILFPGTGCRNGCTFEQATAVAGGLRPSGEFSKYCCHDYSVWQNNQTGAFTIVPGQSGTAGFGWRFVKGQLCCEEAEALAGIPGACSESNNNVNNTKCWPGSYAALNPQTHRVECFCNPGLIWNSTKTACIPDPNKTDCSGYPGSYAAYNQQTKRMECFCPTGTEWNSTRTACVTKTTGVTCYPGTYAAKNPQTNRVECYCNPGLVWNSTRTACVDPQDLVRAADCSGYPGSVAGWNTQTQRVECNCPTGKVWNNTRTACVDANATADCSGYPGTVAVWNSQTQRMECQCPAGKTWDAARMACVDIKGNNNNGNNNGNGNSATWTLVSTTIFPQNDKSWKVSSGSAHMDVYNGDKADFSWSPPPGQFNSSGFNININVNEAPKVPGATMSSLICVGSSDLTADKEDKCAHALVPGGSSGASQSVHFTPSSAYSDIEVNISLMWGSAGVTYKYKKN